VRIVKQQFEDFREIFESTLPAEQTSVVLPTDGAATTESPHLKPGPKMTPAMKRREERRKEIKDLIAAGESIRGVTRNLKIARATVRRYLHHEHLLPDTRRKESKPTNPELYFEYLKQRWDSGCNNAAQLWRELHEQGYKGSHQTLRRYLESWRGNTGAKRSISGKPKILSVWRIAYLLQRHDVAKNPLENRLISKALEQIPGLAEAVSAVRQFTLLLKRRRGDLFSAWLRKATGSKDRSLRNMAVNMNGDRDAIKAAMELDWSNGQLEGQVNHIKVIKRQMYGRGRFGLFRKRVLLAGSQWRPAINPNKERSQAYG